MNVQTVIRFLQSLPSNATFVEAKRSDPDVDWLSVVLEFPFGDTAGPTPNEVIDILAAFSSGENVEIVKLDCDDGLFSLKIDLWDGIDPNLERLATKK